MQNFNHTEQFQAEIMPLIKQLMEKCQALGIPFVVLAAPVLEELDDQRYYISLVKAAGCPQDRTPIQIQAAAQMAELTHEAASEVLEIARECAATFQGVPLDPNMSLEEIKAAMQKMYEE